MLADTFAKAATCLVMAAGAVTQLAFQYKKENDEMREAPERHDGAIILNSAILVIATVCYLGILTSVSLNREGKTIKRAEFLARSVCSALLFPVFSYRDFGDFEKLQMLNLGHLTVCTFAAQSFAENPTDMAIAWGVSFLVFFARTASNVSLGISSGNTITLLVISSFLSCLLTVIFPLHSLLKTPVPKNRTSQGTSTESQKVDTVSQGTATDAPCAPVA